LERFLAGKCEAWQISKIISALEARCRGSKGPDKKDDGAEVFHSFNIDFGRQAHRAIFERVELDSKPYYMLRDFAWAHGYRDALGWEPLHQVTEEIIRQLYKQDFKLITSNSASEAAAEAAVETRRVFYRYNFLLLNLLQEAVLNHLRIPAVLTGPPGSGKSLVTMGLLQERAKTHFENQQEEVLQLLYIVSNEGLLRTQQQTWHSFAQQHFPNNYTGVIVTFMTVAQFEANYARDKAHLNSTQIAEFLKNTNESERCELYHNAWCLEQDERNNRPYEQSLYQDVGARNSVYANDERPSHYVKLTEYFKRIREEKRFIPGLSAMTDLDPFYDLVILDEAQQEHPTLHHGLLKVAKDYQVVFAGDSYQKGKKRFSPLASLPPSAKLLFGVTITHNELKASLRLKRKVRKLVNAAILLYAHANGGRADSLAYKEIEEDEDASCAPEPAEDSDVVLLLPLQNYIHDKTCQESFRENREKFRENRQQSRLAQTNAGAKDLERIAQEEMLTVLGNDPNAAAIVLTDNDKLSAQLLIQGTIPFNPDDARGIEFSRTLLYLSAETLNRFAPLSALMREMGITPDKELPPLSNLSANKGQFDGEVLALLSDLIVALSRTQGKLYVYIDSTDSPRNIEYFMNWFRHQLGQTISSQTVNAVKSSKEDWINTANRFIDANALPQARDALIDRLGYSGEDADNYIKERIQQYTWQPTQQQHTPQPNQENVRASAKQQSQAAVSSSKAQRDEAAAKQKQTDEAVPAKSNRGAVSKPVAISAPQNAIVNFDDLVEKLFNDINPINIKLLFDQPNATELLFNHPMKNNNKLTLWLNICINKTKLVSFIDGIEDNKKNKSIFENGIKIQEGNYWGILFLLMIKAHWGKLLNQGAVRMLKDRKPKIDECLYPALIHTPNAVAIIICSTLVDWDYYLSVEDQYLTQQQVSLKFPQTLLRFILVVRPVWTLQQPSLQKLLGGKTLLSVSNFPMEALSLLECMFMDTNGLDYVINNMDSLFHDMDASTKEAAIYRSNEGFSLFYNMCAFEQYFTLLKTTWSYSKPILSKKPEYLFLPMTKEGEHQSLTAIFALFLNIIKPGISQLFRDEWSFFMPIIVDNASYFFDQFQCGRFKGKNPFLVLCFLDEFLDFIDAKWSIFSTIIQRHSNQLFDRDAEENINIMYTLVNNSKGLALVKKHWTDFANCFKGNEKHLFRNLGPDSKCIFDILKAEGLTEEPYQVSDTIKGLETKRQLIKDAVHNARYEDSQAFFPPATNAPVSDSSSNAAHAAKHS